MKKVLVLCLVFALGHSVLGSEKIEAAFGLKLGDPFDPAKATKSENPQYTGGYVFVPEHPNKIFSEYIVFVTPVSHRIYRIVAFGRDRDSQSKLSDLIAVLISRKYGDGSFTHGPGQVTQGTRAVSSNNLSRGNMGTEFSVSYEDLGLAQRDVLERLEADLNGVDSTGL